jgi:serine/threonine protein kinase/Flp pilus assembly protein TadD
VGATPDIKSVFGQVMALASAEERAAYLQQACAGDPALRAEIESLLQADRDAGSFLRELNPCPTSSVNTPITERPGTVIGLYKLLEQIGEGGFGVVFMAEQQEPVRRKVALKVIKPGMDTRQVIARFEAERQALVIMDHPNIAKFLEGGTTAAGRPYFVMELVKGAPITEFCDQNHLTPAQRLELFVSVCQAVQHAHQKGIIHRDLKPSNVLVSRHDTTPIVKVIDFGVAKALGQTLTDKTLFTGLAQMIGTPVYMSPEQAGMSDLDIDTRSDIYALGVLLYELLTGTTPFDKERFRSAAYEEIRRIIREEEPPKPSTRLSELGRFHAPQSAGGVASAPLGVTPREASTLASVSAMRQTEPAKLTKLIRGELDWIVMKALEKDRDRRYETASAFAADLRHYLNDEPVQACPPSAAYRFRKFARKYRTPLRVAGAFLLLLIIAVIASSWLALRATRAEHLAGLERDRAMAAEAQARDGEARAIQAEGDAKQERDKAVIALRRAEQGFRQARQAVDDMYTQVAEKWLARQPRMEPVQRQFLQKALQFYVEFTKETSKDPGLRMEAAWAYRRVGDIQYRLGATGPAEKALKQAVAAMRKLVDEFPAEPSYRQALAATMDSLAELLTDTARCIEAERICREAVVLHEKLAADFPGVPDYRRDLARGLYCLADISRDLGQHEISRALLPESALRLKELVEDFPSVPEYRSYLVDSYLALHDCNSALPVVERLVADFPSVPDYRSQLATCYLGMAGASLPRKAENTLRQALATQEKLVVDYPAVNNYRLVLKRSLHMLGHLLHASARWAEAEQAYLRAAEVGEKLAADTPGVLFYREGLGAIYADLSILLADMDRAREAEKACRQSVAIVESFVETFPNDTVRRINLSLRYFALGDILTVNNRSEEAEQAYRQARKHWNKSLELKPASAASIRAIVRSTAIGPQLRRRERLSASEMAKKLVELEKKSVEKVPDAGSLWNVLGLAHFRARDWKAAISALEKSMELRARDYGVNWFILAMAHWQLGHQDEARQWYELACRGTEYRNWSTGEIPVLCAEATLLLGMPGPDSAIVKQKPVDPLEVYALVLKQNPKATWALGDRQFAYATKRQWEMALSKYASPLELQPDAPGHQHIMAWLLATCPEPKLRDPKRAVKLADKAVMAAPEDVASWTTLGVARYRSGDWTGAAVALQQAVKLSRRAGDFKREVGYALFFQAMAQHQLGHVERARAAYQGSLDWLDANREILDGRGAEAEELSRLRAEAEELPGLKRK